MSDSSVIFHRPTIALLLKAPVEGTVKTRLAKTIGAPAATLAYRRLVEHQISQFPPTWPVRIHFAPAGAELLFHQWLGPNPTYLSQPEGDLGQRLKTAMKEHFATGSDPLFLLGGDCPYLMRDVLEESFARLNRADGVLVPSVDGGYCLLGIRRPSSLLFQDIAWSTNQVADQTRDRLREAGFRWEEMPPLEDVDNFPSWQRAQRQLPPV